MDERALLEKRCRELALRAETRGITCCSEFLSLDEQSVARAAGARVFAGGYEGAERRMAVFGGTEEDAPIVLLRGGPRSPQFAEKLSHRDLLGSLMALGLRRSVFGDLLPEPDGHFCLPCLAERADFVAENWTQARHTAITVSRTETPPAAVLLPEESRVVISSERLDALIAAVWKLSRGESQRLFGEGLVFLNGAEEPRVSREMHPGDVITVRGTGRFRYEGVECETKKGRLRAVVRVWR